MKGKKGVIDQLVPLVLALVSIGIVLIVGFLILSELGENTKVSDDTNATAAVKQVTNATSDIPTWLPIIVITVIGALLIGLVSLFRRR